MHVAFLGLGTMGAGMARNLLARGHAVRGWNRSAAKAEPLRELGLELAATPAAAAHEADAAITCLTDDAAVEQVVLGEQGVLAGLPRGALLIDCSTTSFALTERIAAAAAARGIAFVDAPITGSKLGAAGARLTFMVGGAPEHVARAQPLFDAMGRHVVHVGERVGQGQAAKYCLNMTQAIVLEGVLEGYVLARALDVPLAKMAEIYENSAGKTGVGSFKTPYLEARDFEPHFRLDLMHKDLHLALREAEDRRMPLPAAQAVRVLYDQAVAEGMGPRDFVAIVQLLERWAGVVLGAPPDASTQPKK
jgi:3-hydroxyisobutyrate dehydrogenase-like beta-hydroxyacid dehydrogenase